MSKAARFWDRFAARYSRTPVPDEAIYQQKLETTQQYFTPEMEVLEIGCGTGSTAIVHAPHVKHIRAVDISQRMLEIAKDKATSEGIENITFEQASLDELEVEEESVDVILCLSILHLLEDRDAALRKLFKMLKPNGMLVSSTTCLGDNMGFFKVVGPLGYRLGVIPLLRVFTSDELKESIENTGFTIDHEWLPGKGKAIFIIAQKPEPKPIPLLMPAVWELDD